MSLQDFRRNYLSKRIFTWARGALPALSDTERDALNAGDVWWDAELFTGSPDYAKLLAVKAPRLTDEEQAFLDGPCEALCAMVQDWTINWEEGDLPQEVWDYLRKQKFFGMIIERRHGGLGFSAYAHSEVVRKLSTRSIALAVTVMVPNSLGPGELLHMFGTSEQQQYWLPKLASGDEIPAFALTSESAGSDASAMVDTAVVCHGRWNGEDVVGLRLNWSKRYITLSPVATVLGLACKMYDPDQMLGGPERYGITCVLVPTHLEGVVTGRRHIPSGQMFQNGPTEGHDVFVPLDHIIGDRDYAGRGWMMLMSALAVGRGISLPSLSAAATAFSAHTAGAYARIRRQFNTPISQFGGIQRRLGRLAAQAYVLDAGRRLTCAGLDEGRALAVISAIMKSNATYRMREAVDDAMDVHAGKTVIDGPKNYLGNFHRATPVGITVEGANILTRNMIIFGQGAIRCHPYVLKEMLALQEADREAALDAFDQAFWAHVRHTTANLFKAWFRAWTGGVFAPAPDAGKATRYYRQLSRWASAFALTADMALVTLGGSLKRREMLSARMGDVLSELYLLSAALKRWEDEGRQDADLPVLQYIAASSIATIRRSLDEVLANMPARITARLIRCLIVPGGSNRGPADRLTRRCAALLTESSPTRERLTQNLFRGGPADSVFHLEAAFRAVTDTETLRSTLEETGKTLEEAKASGPLSEEDIARLEEADALVARVIAVDDFAAGEISGRLATHSAAASSGRTAARQRSSEPEAAA